uniref:C2 domain-containing protein n=1 Tax=Romanomermis culicivorax TaxID=13658 RepID=A0A915L4D6_ROMCU
MCAQPLYADYLFRRVDSLKLKRLGLKHAIIEDPNRPDNKFDARIEVRELTLTSADEIRNNRRFRLLQLRDQGVGEFKHLKAIPADKSSITDDYFAEFDAQKSKEVKNIDLNDLEACQIALASFIADIRENIATKVISTQDTKSYSDIVNEIYLPSIGSLGLLFFEDSGRPLKPARVDRQKQPALGVQSKAQIFVNVLRAQNLPMRSDSSIDSKVSLQPFVEISYKDQSIRSSRSQGQNATWNQELIFKLDKSKIVYFDITDDESTLSFDIFDQNESELIEESDSDQDSIHTKISRKWLGGFDVAFSSLVSNNVITESFALNIPLSIFGYRFIREDDTREIKNPYLELYLAVDHADPVNLLEKWSNLESIETPQLLSRLEAWANEYRSQFPGRRLAHLAVDSNGRTALICRYLSSIKPPEIIDQVPDTNDQSDRLKSSMEKWCRIVSLIPSTRDNVCFSGICSLWNSCDQILATRCADDEEKAVLLYCWLSSLNQMQQCFLIWLNIQANDRPSGMSFEVEREDFWRPLFKKGFANPGLSSLQPTFLEYNENNNDRIMELQEKIDKSIKESFVKWRIKRSPTLESVFSIESDNLRKIDLVEKHHRAMKDIVEMYQVYGFPLNQGFSSIKQLLKMVKRTKIHCNGHPDVEFSLATHIHAYTNDILSVWIYVVSLEKRSSHRL